MNRSLRDRGYFKRHLKRFRTCYLWVGVAGRMAGKTGGGESIRDVGLGGEAWVLVWQEVRLGSQPLPGGTGTLGRVLSRGMMGAPPEWTCYERRDLAVKQCEQEEHWGQ